MKKKIGLIAGGVLALFVLLFIFCPIAAWIIIGLIVLMFAVLLNIPIGADVSFIDERLLVRARADGFSIQLFPRKPREPKPEEPKPEEPEPPKERKPRKPINLELTFDEIMEILKKAFRGIGKFGKVRVRRFMLHFVAAGNDPYNTAVAYNYINAGLSILAPVCCEKFIVKDTDVWTDIDFTKDFPELDTEISLTIRLAQIFHMVFAILFGVLGVLIRNRIRVFKEKLANRGRKNKNVDNDEVIQIEQQHTEDNSNAEERKDSNGE